MSDLKVDGIIASTGTNTALTLQGKGSGKVDIGDGALSFPDADGDADQVIKTDGSGALSFATVGGAWNFIGTAEASGSASLTITGLGTDYDIYAIGLSALTPGTGNAVPWIRLGDSSGIDSASGDYDYASTSLESDNTHTNIYSASSTAIVVGTGDMGAIVTAGISGMYYLGQPSDSATYSSISGNSINSKSTTSMNVHSGGGQRVAALVHDRVQFLFHTGTITTGRLTVWGLAHA
jgi:hypothetical protein